MNTVISMVKEIMLLEVKDLQPYRRQEILKWLNLQVRRVMCRDKVADGWEIALSKSVLPPCMGFFWRVLTWRIAEPGTGRICTRGRIHAFISGRGAVCFKSQLCGSLTT